MTTGTAICGPRKADATGTIINAEPKPENPRITPAKNATAAIADASRTEISGQNSKLLLSGK